MREIFMDKYIEMKISAKANVHNTAKLIEEVIQNNLGVKIVAIGAGAVNQAVKAIAAGHGAGNGFGNGDGANGNTNGLAT
jgi:stage V sporulation protein SpoVS